MHPSLLPALLILAASPVYSQQGNVIASGPAQTAPATVPETTFDVPDTLRQSILFTRYAFDLRLETADASLHARAIVTVKNEGAAPVAAVPLQISSSLQWEGADASGASLHFRHHTVPTDADHTGAMNEALVALPSPLAPGAEQTMTVFYSGPVEPTAQRLIRIGTPPDVAIHADWDGIREDFTGLRGFGNVLWYPVCSVPVALGDGDRFFSQIGMTKLRQSSALVSMAVTEEFHGADAPTVAFLDGTPVPVNVTPSPAGSELPGVATAKLPPAALGFAMPTLFLAKRTAETGSGLSLYVRETNAAATQAYMTAASILSSPMSDWLGTPKSALNILDAADPQDSPYEERALLLTHITDVAPRALLSPLSHVLAHAYFTSPRPWLQEGVAEFMASLWTEQQKGRDIAITQMDNQRGALTLAETADPDSDAGQPLIAAHDPVFYRTKALYVLWMLRGIVGDKALAAAFKQYDAAQDTNPAYFEHLLEHASGQTLDWFFQDWVNRDRGLPDLAITNITPSRGSTEDSYIVAITVSNSGTAVADVPVTLSSADATITERMRIPPRGNATRRFLIHGRPTMTQVNDGTTPEIEASVHRKEIGPLAPG